MKVTDTFDELNARAGHFRSMLTLLLLATVVLFVSSPARAGDRYYKSWELSDALEADGFGTLRFALKETGLLSTLDSNRVTLFAPTDDVFEATAQALKCDTVEALATHLLNTPVGDSNALAVVLSYHAVLRVIRTNNKLLKSSPLHAANGGALTTGVNSEGLFVKGEINATPSSITVDGIRGHRWVIYPIDSILLPIDPTGICGPVGDS